MSPYPVFCGKLSCLCGRNRRRRGMSRSRRLMLGFCSICLAAQMPQPTPKSASDARFPPLLPLDGLNAIAPI